MCWQSHILFDVIPIYVENNQILDCSQETSAKIYFVLSDFSTMGLIIKTKPGSSGLLKLACAHFKINLIFS